MKGQVRHYVHSLCYFACSPKLEIVLGSFWSTNVINTHSHYFRRSLLKKNQNQQQNSGLHFKTEVIFCIKRSLLKEAFLPVLWAQQFPIIFQQTLQGMQCSCSYLCSHKHKPLREVEGCACKTHVDIRFRSSVRAKLAQQCLVSWKLIKVKSRDRTAQTVGTPAKQHGGGVLLLVNLSHHSYRHYASRFSETDLAFCRTAAGRAGSRLPF